jgi:hypothetical protein
LKKEEEESVKNRVEETEREELFKILYIRKEVSSAKKEN